MMLQQLVVAGTALALGATVSAMVRLRVPLWVFLLLAGLSVGVVLTDTQWRILSHHGFLHDSIVYEILDRGAPPENPLLAGERLHYPYAVHWLAAQAMRVFVVSPTWLFAALNVGSIVLFAVVLDHAARLVDRDPVYRVFSVVIAMLGVNLFAYGPLAAIASTSGWPIEPRSMPWEKFTTVNTNQVGLVLTAVALVGLLRLGARVGHRHATWGLLGVAILAAAFLYPLAWALMLVWTGAVALLLGLRERTWREAFSAAGTAAGASIIALPFLVATVGVRLGAPAMSTHLVRNAGVLIAALVPGALAAWVRRADLRATWSSRGSSATVLLVTSGTPLLLFLTVPLPLRAEYKFLAAAMLPLGLLLAPALRGLHQARPAVAAAVLALLSLPAISVASGALSWHAADPAMIEGRDLRHADPAENALYRWITEHTQRDAVFLDDRLTVPAFARRSLFVGLGLRQPPVGEHDGWELPAATIVAVVTGGDPERIATRRHLAEELLVPSSPPPPPESLRDALLREGAGRPLYVIARSDSVRRRLAIATWLGEVYSGPSAVIFRVVDTRRSAGEA